MCVGQLGSLLPHVVVPSILAGFLIPEWHLTGAQAGLLAGSGAAGYMLTVPLLATTPFWTVKAALALLDPCTTTPLALLTR